MFISGEAYDVESPDSKVHGHYRSKKLKQIPIDSKQMVDKTSQQVSYNVISITGKYILFYLYWHNEDLTENNRITALITGFY